MTYIDGAGTEKVNLIAAPPGQDVADRAVDLAFLCHTDTVPYAKDWLQALLPVRQGAMLHGCGACDVKGFLACLLAAAESKGGQWISGLRIVLTADEEVGCIGTKQLIATDSLRPRRLVVGEPTLLRAAVQERVIVSRGLRSMAERRTAHSGARRVGDIRCGTSGLCGRGARPAVHDKKRTHFFEPLIHNVEVVRLRADPQRTSSPDAPISS